MSWNPFENFANSLGYVPQGKVQVPSGTPGPQSLDLNKIVANFMQPTKRLDMSGRLEDATQPTGLDWIKAHGPGQHSWEQPLNGNDFQRAANAAQQSLASNWHLPQQSMAANEGVHETPFGQVGMHDLKIGEHAQPFTVEGQNGQQWLMQHALANGNPAALEHIKNLSPDQLSLFAQDKGYQTPRNMQPWQEGRNVAAHDALHRHSLQDKTSELDRMRNEAIGQLKLFDATISNGGRNPYGEDASYTPFKHTPSGNAVKPTPHSPPEQTTSYNPFEAGKNGEAFTYPPNSDHPNDLLYADNAKAWLKHKFGALLRSLGHAVPSQF